MGSETYGSNLAVILNDPSVFNGLKFASGFGSLKEHEFLDFFNKSIVERATRELIGRYDKNMFQIFSTTIECRELSTVGKEVIPELIKKIGGWPDFLIRGDDFGHISCDFTICGKNNDGKTLAIVHKADATHYTNEKKSFGPNEMKFMDAVYEAFEIK